VIDEVLSKILKQGMTEREKVKAVYDFHIFQFTHGDHFNGPQDRLPSSPMIEFSKDDMPTSLNHQMNRLSNLYWIGWGVCDDFAASFAAMLTRLGIKAEIWVGMYLNRDGTSTAHAWNRAYVDGAWRWYDVDVEGTVYRRGGTVLYYLYEKGDKEWETTHGSMHLSVDVEDMSYCFKGLPPYGQASAPTAAPAPIATPVPQAAPTPGLPEIDSPSSWAAEAVANGALYGVVPPTLLKGYTKPVSRGNAAQMFVNIVEKVSGIPIDDYVAQQGKSVSNSFTDTSDKAILAANALGILSGVGDGRFDPDGTLTRAQSAIITNRVAIALNRSTIGFTHTFVDTAGHWVDKELGWPVVAGIISGIGEGRFDPDGALTTEQAIVIAVRAFEYLRDH
jgi:hypothetical protein